MLHLPGFFPARRPSVLQQLDVHHAVLATHYHWPGDTDFGWVVTTPSPVAISAPAVTTQPAHPWAHRAPLLVAAGASFAASGTLYALAAHASGTFDRASVLDANATQEERDAARARFEKLQAKANPETIAYAAAGGLGLVFGVAAVVTW